MASWRLQLPPSGTRRLWRIGERRDNATNVDVRTDQPRGLIRNQNDGSGAESKEGEKEEEKEEIGEIPEGAEELLLEEEVAKIAAAVGESEWEIISEGNSSSGNTTIIISKTGSVRSLPSSGADFSHKLSAVTGGISNHHELSLPSPFTLTRSLSNSTIASEENCSFGASCHHSDIVYGIPGVDFVEHVVMPTDTLQGLTLQYKVSATRLRQANQFSGNTLLLAPKKLIIPLSKNGLKTGAIRMQDRTTKDFKVQALMAEFTDMGQDEAKKYLNVSQWDLDGAIRAAGEDGEWEKTSVRQTKRSGSGSASSHELKSGDIHITLKVSSKGVPVSATIRGSGHSGPRIEANSSSTSDNEAADAASLNPAKNSSEDNVLSTTVTRPTSEESECINAESADDEHNVEVQSISSSAVSPGNK